MKIIRSNLFGNIVIYKNLIAHVNNMSDIYKTNSKKDLESFGLNIVSFVDDYVNIAKNIPELEKIIEKVQPFLEEIQVEVDKLQSKDSYSLEEISHLTREEKCYLLQVLLISPLFLP